MGSFAGTWWSRISTRVKAYIYIECKGRKQEHSPPKKKDPANDGGEGRIEYHRAVTQKQKKIKSGLLPCKVRRLMEHTAKETNPSSHPNARTFEFWRYAMAQHLSK